MVKKFNTPIVIASDEQKKCTESCVTARNDCCEVCYTFSDPDIKCLMECYEGYLSCDNVCYLIYPYNTAEHNDAAI